MGPAAHAAKELRHALQNVVGSRLSEAPADRLSYGRDLWPRTILALRDGDPAPFPPELIVWPESAEEVASVVKLAAAHAVPIVAFGGGSDVCGAAVPLRGGIVLDLKRMNRLTAVDADALEVTCEAGILGEHLEHELGRRGLTLGHFPSSIHISTLGGWLATRSAGQLSTRYGKIEDMALGLDVVTGAGELWRIRPADRADAGPDWLQLLIGSEGTLGIITAATLRVWPAPEVRLLRGFSFARLPLALEGLRRLLQRGLRPAVVRLYDETDTLIHRLSRSKEGKGADGPSMPDAAARRPSGLEQWLGERRQLLLKSLLAHPRLVHRALGAVAPRLAGGCLLIVGFEGASPLTETCAQLGLRELAQAGGRDLGPEPGERWFQDRYKISFQQSKVFASGAFVDTMEVAATWDRLLDLYHGVTAALSRHGLVMAHFSHAYPEGCSIYFTFIAMGRDRADAERRYDLLWRSGLTAALDAGGTLSHHHGIGMSKQRFMADEHGNGMHLLRALKRVLDPAGILNPGKLGLP